MRPTKMGFNSPFNWTSITLLLRKHVFYYSSFTSWRHNALYCKNDALFIGYSKTLKCDVGALQAVDKIVLGFIEMITL